MTKLMIGLMMAGALVVGCGDKGGGGGEKGAEKGAEKSAGGESIGVKECDEYLNKMDACLKKMPEAGRAASQEAMKANRDSWKQMAAEPATKAALAGACKSALDALAQNPMCK